MIEPLLASCRTNLGAERQLREAERAIQANDPAQARLLLESIDREASAWEGAQAALAWLDAERTLREADFRFERGDASGAVALLERVRPAACGPHADEASAGIRARAEGWRDVENRVDEAWRLLDAGDLARARVELDALRERDPSLHAYGKWAVTARDAVDFVDPRAGAAGALATAVDWLHAGNDLMGLIWLRAAVARDEGQASDARRAVRALAGPMLDRVETALAAGKPRLAVEAALRLLDPALEPGHPLRARLEAARRRALTRS